MGNNEHQNILLELRAMKDLWSILVDCIEKINCLKTNYVHYISSLKETGVPQETCGKYEEEYYQNDLVNMGVLMNNFQTRDFPAIRNNINRVLTHGNAIGLNMDMESLQLASVGTIGPGSGKAPYTIRQKHRQDYEDQLNAYGELMDFLVDQHVMLTGIRDFYTDTCKRMEDNGVPVQVAQFYHVNCYLPNVRQFNKILSHLESDYAFLKEPYLVLLQSLQEINPYKINKYPKAM